MRRPADLRARTIAVLPSLAAAIVATTSDGAPTGSVGMDIVLRFVFVFAVAGAARRAPTASVLLLVLVAILAGGPFGWRVASGVCVVALSGLSVWVHERASATADRGHLVPLARSTTVGVSLQALLRLDAVGFDGATSLLVAIVVAPCVVLGHRQCDAALRHRLVIVWRTVAGFVVLAIVLSGLAVFLGRRDVNRALDAIDRGTEAVKDGNQDAAIAELSLAAKSFSSAKGDFDAWWATPGRFMPVLAQHHDALSVAAREGAALSEAGLEVARAADIDDITAEEGTVDVGLITKIEQPLRNAVAELRTSRSEVLAADSLWLLPPLETRLNKVIEDIDDVLPDAERAVDAVEQLPALLGADAPRRYLVLFGTPAEARELGGLLGNFAEIEIDNGRIQLSATGRNTDLNASSEQLALPAGEFPSRYRALSPEVFSQNLTASPDFPTVARAVRRLYPQMGGQPIDGVLYMDPYALQALLRFTGPIELEGRGRPLDAETAADFLLREQYVDFPEKSERVDFLSTASEVAFERLLDSDIPGPREISDVLGPIVDEGRLLFTTFEAPEVALLEDLGVVGALEHTEGRDFLSVVHSNSGANKLDAYLTREIDYDVVFDPASGGLRAVVTVRLSNHAPAGLPDYVTGGPQPGRPLATSTVDLSVYTPHEVQEASVDGTPTPAEAHLEYGLSRFVVPVRTEPGDSTTVKFELVGAIEAGGRYELHVAVQPLVAFDRVLVDVAVPPGWIPAPGSEVPSPFDLREDMTVERRFDPE